MSGEVDRRGKKKGLFVFLGESFRTGGQTSRTRGRPESYADQRVASDSHLRFLRSQVSTGAVGQADVLVITYSTPYDTDITAWYTSEDSISGRVVIIDQPAIGYDKLFIKSLDEYVLPAVSGDNGYDFIQYIRVDCELKPAFFELFDPTVEEVTFSSAEWICDVRCSTGEIRVTDMLLFVPRRVFAPLLTCRNAALLSHFACRVLRAHGDLPFRFMVNTLHDSDSAKDWNPLYRVVNRPECGAWASRGYRNDPRDGQVKHGGDGDETVDRVEAAYADFMGLL